VTHKVALIVGAGSTIGGEIARAIAERGYRSALNDLSPTRIEVLAKELGNSAQAFEGDVSRKLGLQTMLQDVLARFERIDVLVFIANVQPRDAVLDMDEWDWHRAIDLNLTAAFLCMQSVGRVMREIGGGVIVNVLSPASLVSAAYAVATAGIEALSRAAEAEFAGHNIRVLVAKEVTEVLSLINAT
jgi:3-oxoacyl-[acyl-carrier protein] reductase